MRIQRNTKQKYLVLRSISESDGAIHGLRICARTRLKSGTVYPMLLEFKKLGLVKSEWEDIDPTVEKRPRRKYYSLNPTGQSMLNELADEYENCAGDMEPIPA